MNKILYTGACLITSLHLYAQQPPTIDTPSNGGMSNGNYWSRAGNLGNPGDNNIFGTRWNSPIYFITGGLTQDTYRMRLVRIMDQTI